MFTVSYKYRDDYERENQCETLEQARAFYDDMNDEMVEFATLLDNQGNVLEEK